MSEKTLEDALAHAEGNHGDCCPSNNNCCCVGWQDDLALLADEVKRLREERLVLFQQIRKIIDNQPHISMTVP